MPSIRRQGEASLRPYMSCARRDRAGGLWWRTAGPRYGGRVFSGARAKQTFAPTCPVPGAIAPGDWRWLDARQHYLRDSGDPDEDISSDGTEDAGAP
jgi:hypothetical protein